MTQWNNENARLKQEELYSLPVSERNQQAEQIRNDLKGWAQQNFEFSTKQQECMDMLPDEYFQETGYRLARAVEKKHPIDIFVTDDTLPAAKRKRGDYVKAGYSQKKGYYGEYGFYFLKLKARLDSLAFFNLHLSMRNSISIFFIFLFGLNYAQVPFQCDSVFKSIRLDITVAGVTKKALFDNGFDLSVIFLEEKNDLDRFDVERETFIIDAKGNRNPAYLLKKVKIEIAQLDIKAKQNILAFIGVPKVLKELNVSFVLGNNFIEKFDWKIDFEQNYISIVKDFDELETDSIVSLKLLQSTRPGNFMELISNQVADTFRIDFGNSNTLMTSNKKLFKDPQFVKISKNESINGFSIDTLLMHVENNLKLSEKLCVTDLPIFVQNTSYSNLIGLDFFIPFGQIYLVNSERLMLMPKINRYQYTYRKEVRYNNEVLFQE